MLHPVRPCRARRRTRGRRPARTRRRIGRRGNEVDIDAADRNRRRRRRRLRRRRRDGARRLQRPRRAAPVCRFIVTPPPIVCLPFRRLVRCRAPYVRRQRRRGGRQDRRSRLRRARGRAFDGNPSARRRNPRRHGRDRSRVAPCRAGARRRAGRVLGRSGRRHAWPLLPSAIRRMRRRQFFGRCPRSAFAPARGLLRGRRRRFGRRWIRGRHRRGASRRRFGSMRGRGLQCRFADRDNGRRVFERRRLDRRIGNVTWAHHGIERHSRQGAGRPFRQPPEMDAHGHAPARAAWRSAST